MKSATVPVASSRPRPITIRGRRSVPFRHQVTGHQNGSSLVGQDRSRCAPQRMPSGSRPLIASSKIRTSGSRAAPQRYRGAAPYRARTRSPGDAPPRSDQPSRAPRRHELAATNSSRQADEVVARAATGYAPRPRPAARRPRAAEIEGCRSCARRPSRCRGRGIQADDHPHRRRLSAPVGTKKTVTCPPATVN